MYLPPRRPEAPVEEKPTSIFAARTAKPASSLSTARTAADEGDDVYKTHPIFTSIVEPFANKFMSLKELIEVSDLCHSHRHEIPLF